MTSFSFATTCVCAYFPIAFNDNDLQKLVSSTTQRVNSERKASTLSPFANRRCDFLFRFGQPSVSSLVPLSTFCSKKTALATIDGKYLHNDQPGNFGVSPKSATIGPNIGVPGIGVPGPENRIGVPCIGVPGIGVFGAGVLGFANIGVPGIGVLGFAKNGVLGVANIGVAGIGVPGIGVPGSATNRVLGFANIGVPGQGVPGTGVPGTGTACTGVSGMGVDSSCLPRILASLASLCK